MAIVNIAVDNLVVIIPPATLRTAHLLDTAIGIIKIKHKFTITFCTVSNILIYEHKRCAIFFIGGIISC